MVTKRGKEFFEENAPGCCEFVRTEIFHTKRKKVLEDEVFILNMLVRFDSIDFELSELEPVRDHFIKSLGQAREFRFPDYRHPKIVMRAERLGAAPIWRERFFNSLMASYLFVSEELKQRMVAEKIVPGAAYIPVALV